MKSIERTKKGNYFATGLAIGIPIGMPIALALGYIVLAPLFGIVIGLVFGWAMESQHKNNSESGIEESSGISKKALWIFFLMGVIVFTAEILIYFNNSQIQ